MKDDGKDVCEFNELKNRKKRYIRTDNETH